jgi:hypothetical protein
MAPLLQPTDLMCLCRLEFGRAWQAGSRSLVGMLHKASNSL